MSVAKVIEITAESTDSIDDAIRTGVKRASETVDNIRGVWVKEIKADVNDENVTNFRVDMKVTFVLSS